MRLNTEEIVYGAVFGASLFLWTKWLAIPCALICALLWAIGGSGTKLFRRLGCPVVQAVAIHITTGSLTTFLSIIPAFGILSIGYGIPDSTDKGSTLGRFFYDLTGRNNLYANLFTRGLIMVMLWWSFILPLIKTWK